MSLSRSLMILLADERTRRQLLQVIDAIEMASTPRIFLDFDELREAEYGEEMLLCLADLRLLPSPTRTAHWLTVRPDVRLLVLHPQNEEETVLAYLQAGAMGHLALEEISVQRVRDAICALLNSEAFLSPSIAGRILDLISRGVPNSETGKEVQDRGTT